LASIAAMIPSRRRFRSSYLYSDSPAFSGLGIRRGWTSRFSDPFTNSDDGDTLIGQRHFGVETRVIATRRVSEENRRNKFPHLRFGLPRATNCSKPKGAGSLRSSRSVAENPADRHNLFGINDFPPDFDSKIPRLECQTETGLSVPGILFRACSFIDRQPPIRVNLQLNR